MTPLLLSDEEVQQPQSNVNTRSWTHSIMQRVQIALACGTGETITTIAFRTALMGLSVGNWRKRYRIVVLLLISLLYPILSLLALIEVRLKGQSIGKYKELQHMFCSTALSRIRPRR